MSATMQQSAIAAPDLPWQDPAWPECEATELPGDDSMRWLGMVMFGVSAMVTLRGLLWVGQTIAAHL